MTRKKARKAKHAAHGWRARRPLALVGLRAMFIVLGVIAPWLAARLANYLWFRPQRHRLPAREQALRHQAQSNPMVIGGKTIAVNAWGEGPTVLLVHGWSGRGTQLGDFVAPLQEAGYRVVAFDAPAHGLSGGRDTTLPEVSEIILKLARHYGPLHAVIAHSFGVPCVLYALQQERFAPRVVGISAPATLAGLVEKFSRQLALSPRTVQIFGAILVRRFGDDMWQRFSAQTIAASADVPALIIHDHDDRDVSWHEGEAVANAWAHARFLRTEGLGHRRILRDPGVIARALDFIGQPAEETQSPNAAKDTTSR